MQRLAQALCASPRPGRMDSEPDSPSGKAEDGVETEPTFLQLLGGNAKVVGILFLFATLCYGVWRGLRLLFPDVAWLQR